MILSFEGFFYCLIFGQLIIYKGGSDMLTKSRVVSNIQLHQDGNVRLEKLMEDGTSKVILTDFDRFRDLLSISFKKVEASARIGLMPSGFIDAILVKDNTFMFFQYVPGGLYPFVGRDEYCIEATYPHLLFAWYVVEGVLKDTYLYALKKPLDDKGFLEQRVFLYPYGNVYSSSGRVCWGANVLTGIRNITDVSYHYMDFFTSKSNGDLFLQKRNGMKLLEYVHTMDAGFQFDQLFPFLMDTEKSFITVKELINHYFNKFEQEVVL